MRRAGKQVSDCAVEEFLCRLKDDYPDPVDPLEEAPADGQRFRRRPDPSYEEWRRLSARSSAGE